MRLLATILLLTALLGGCEQRPVVREGPNWDELTKGHVPFIVINPNGQELRFYELDNNDTLDVVAIVTPTPNFRMIDWVSAESHPESWAAWQMRYRSEKARRQQRPIE